jgi:hypothetical protein
VRENGGRNLPSPWPHPSTSTSSYWWLREIFAVRISLTRRVESGLYTLVRAHGTQPRRSSMPLLAVSSKGTCSQSWMSCVCLLKLVGCNFSGKAPKAPEAISRGVALPPSASLLVKLELGPFGGRPDDQPPSSSPVTDRRVKLANLTWSASLSPAASPTHWHQ